MTQIPLKLNAKLLNGASIEKALVQAFIQWAESDINDVHWREQFTEAKWPYKKNNSLRGTTIRRNPSAPIPEAGTPRDIYDFGKLYESGVNSFQLTITPSLARASWHWDATNTSGEEYAIYVHEGRGSNLTARRFTDDIAIAASFFQKKPGGAWLSRVTNAINSL